MVFGFTQLAIQEPLETTTDANGLYQFPNLMPAKIAASKDEFGFFQWHVRVEASGYESLEQQVTLQPNRLTEVNLRLQREPDAGSEGSWAIIVSGGGGTVWQPSFADQACDQFKQDLPFDDQCTSDTTSTTWEVGGSLDWTPRGSWVGLRGGVFYGRDGKISYENVATTGTVAAGNQVQLFNRSTAELSSTAFRIGPSINAGPMTFWPYDSLESTHLDATSEDERQRLGVTDLSHSDTIDERAWSNGFGVAVGVKLGSSLRVGTDFRYRQLGDIFPPTTPPNNSRAPESWDSTPHVSAFIQYLIHLDRASAPPP